MLGFDACFNGTDCGESNSGTKLERTRDLFEQALEKCPPKSSKPLFLMYAQLEEEHGLAKRAMSIYDRATQSIADEDKFEVCCTLQS